MQQNLEKWPQILKLWIQVGLWRKVSKTNFISFNFKKYSWKWIIVTFTGERDTNNKLQILETRWRELANLLPWSRCHCGPLELGQKVQVEGETSHFNTIWLAFRQSLALRLYHWRHLDFLANLFTNFSNCVGGKSRWGRQHELAGWKIASYSLECELMILRKSQNVI